jgi:hypothetical protein
MAQTFPEFTALQSAYLLEFESKINQDSPLNNKAFLRILSYVLALIAVLLRVEVINASKENLAITASRAGLIKIGTEYDTPIKDAVATVLTINLPTNTDPTTIPALTNFTGDANGIIYYNTEQFISAAGSVDVQVTARTAGAIGNLTVGKTLTIAKQIPGAQTIATISSVDTTGAASEETEVYRQRVLDIIRAPGGGANSADYRNWAQGQEGVKRAYPYASNPDNDEPPYRTVYIECDDDIDPDGIAPSYLLDDTKDTIITNATTGQHRQPLGITNDTLGVLSITRTSFYTTISGLVYISGTEADVQDQIDTAVDAYFLGLNPFVQGLDIDADRNDEITSGSIWKVVQQVLEANGASAESVVFGDMPATTVPRYTLGQGEKAKNGGITFNS